MSDDFQPLNLKGQDDDGNQSQLTDAHWQEIDEQPEEEDQ